MALQLGALWDALDSAQGATAEQARRASEEVAAHETRFTRVETDLTLLKWMVGTNVALTFLVLGKQFGVLG